MTNFLPADNGGSNAYDLKAALRSALTGSKLVGYTAEVTQEYAKDFGGTGLHVPLAAVMTKATGASQLVGGARPLATFDQEGTITEIGTAITRELLAGKLGVSMRSTAAASYRLPYTNARPAAQIVDVDAPLADGGASSMDYAEIHPVMAGVLVEVANSLDWTSPDAAQMVQKQISDAVTEAIDQALINGYGPTTVGRTFPGLIGSAVNSGIALNTTSPIGSWASIIEQHSAYTQRVNNPNSKWLMHPRVTDSLLPASPMFAGAANVIGQMGGLSALLGHSIVKHRIPVITAAPDLTSVYYGDFEEIFCVLFNSATIQLIVNPYETTVFSKGASLLRIMISFGMGVRDQRKIVKAGVTLP